MSLFQRWVRSPTTSATGRSSPPERRSGVRHRNDERGDRCGQQRDDAGPKRPPPRRHGRSGRLNRRVTSSHYELIGRHAAL
jgi:hypothetical protein